MTPEVHVSTGHRAIHAPPPHDVALHFDLYQYFVAVYNNTIIIIIIPLALVVYEMIIFNSVLCLVGYLPYHILRTHGIIV